MNCQELSVIWYRIYRQIHAVVTGGIHASIILTPKKGGLTNDYTRSPIA